MGIEIVKAEHALYRYFDASGALLYVGISSSPFRRMAQHRGDKAWWAEVATVTIERHETRRAALCAEAEAIQRERPRYNLAQPSPPKLRLLCRFSYFEPAIEQVVTVPNVAPVGASRRLRCYKCGEMCPVRSFTEYVGGILALAKCRGCGAQVMHEYPLTREPLELWGEVA